MNTDELRKRVVALGTAAQMAEKLTDATLAARKSMAEFVGASSIDSDEGAELLDRVIKIEDAFRAVDEAQKKAVSLCDDLYIDLKFPAATED